MKIKKINEEITFRKSTIEHKFKINGKVVRYYEHKYFSEDICPSDEYEVVVNDEDFDKLTEEEREAFNENELELLDLNENEEYEAI